MSVLIANRGVIANRIIRTLKRMGLDSVAVYSDADANALHVRRADQAIHIGESPAAQSYLNAGRILEVAREAGVRGIHPGYGFLSENAEFARACEAAGIAFIGPTPEQIEIFGLKDRARDLASECGLPLLTGSALLTDVDTAKAAAEETGYPVMLKSTAGGGGIGMQVARNAEELTAAFEKVQRLGQANFGHGGIFLERFIECARHIEVQVFGDGNGKVLALGERDCSAQRRNQKVLEETPAPGLDDETREALYDAAIRLGEHVNYRSAGTVEFLFDADSGEFFFLEVNTRLQVEHGVTEEVLGIDLVEWMVRLALEPESTETLALFTKSYPAQGASIQARLYAENPLRDYQPSTGILSQLEWPQGVRIETGIDLGGEVSAFYDPMIAKIIATGANRNAALRKLSTALDELRIHGVETNLSLLKAACHSMEFQSGKVTTSLLANVQIDEPVIEVIDGGIEALVVDYPGRVGYWHVGVPPSGPMDSLHFQLGNRLLGNREDAAGIEMTVRGVTLKFHVATFICLTGSEMPANVDGIPVVWGSPVKIEQGQVLKIGASGDVGLRAALCVKGGIHVPQYLGSRTTFRLGGFGGYAGRELRPGDMLPLGSDCADGSDVVIGSKPDIFPTISNDWEIAVTYGPHGSPDFFTKDDIEMFFSTDWEVHYNSARTGVRLIGPKPKWARPDGGEAGLHPSNIHDNAYEIGAVDFTGDMPIILGPDGPSLGGFVCPATVIKAELWKLGQLRPGDRIRFLPVSLEDAEKMSKTQSEAIAGLKPMAGGDVEICRDSPILHDGEMVIRRQGDSAVLVEFGEMTLDLHLRFRAQALHDALQADKPEGVLEMTPGIRSIQIRYENHVLGVGDLIDLVVKVDSDLPPVAEMEVSTRTIHLPLSWDDESTQLAIQKYMQSVNKDAPWCPSNIEFIRRINGLDSVEQVKEIVFNASYLVMGLGDVYLGAPVATPLDPRHRLVTTKYNPARTWTPENAVGIGGAYMCIYGMEGPGGYQFVGRTIPIWNRFRTTERFEKGAPWLLRFFDQIRYYPVSAEELMALRRDTLTGKYNPKVEESTFRMSDYDQFLHDNAESISEFRQQQRKAFAEERARWEAAGLVAMEEEIDAPTVAEAIAPVGTTPVYSPSAGNIWKVLVKPGDVVCEGEPILIVESMKMEINCTSTESGTVQEMYVEENKPVKPGQLLAAIAPEKS